ncbi:hypothetical protein M9H77_17837 [Catharanthus roseus]|uniref:Uncharacterized protein n=1 Tax=Catharanthus roseus TaxID=4058 RepID=A0ACC0B5R0_CATRO|nr:hypothetical protein M9H77_17837 [Catharanthus roseus]
MLIGPNFKSFNRGTLFPKVICSNCELRLMPLKPRTFNVSRTLEQNAIKHLHKWKFVAPRVTKDLSINARFATGSAAFMAFLQGNATTLLMEQYFPEIGVTKEDFLKLYG